MSSTTEHETLIDVDVVRDDQRIVQTSGFQAIPEAVSLDATEFVDLADGRTRAEVLSVVSSLDELLTTGAGA